MLLYAVMFTTISSFKKMFAITFIEAGLRYYLYCYLRQRAYFLK
jgi:hypothetical protein